MQNNVNCHLKSSAAQPHLLSHLCSLLWSTLAPRNIRRRASLVSLALCGLALPCIPLYLEWLRHWPCNLKLFLIYKRCCWCWSHHRVTTGPEATRSHWPHLDFTNLLGQVTELKEPCLQLKFHPHKNSDQIINRNLFSGRMFSATPNLGRGVREYVYLVPNMEIQLMYIWKRGGPPYTVCFYSRNKNNKELIPRRLIF